MTDAVFTDSAGDSWTIAITIADVKRVKTLLGIDIAVGAMTATDDKATAPLLTKLATDIVALVDVVYVLVKPQCEARQLTDEQFASRLGGEHIENLYAAFWQAILNFFQSRPATVAAIKKQLELLAIGDKTLEKMIAEVNAAEVISGELSTNGRGFLDLIRADSAAAN